MGIYKNKSRLIAMDGHAADQAVNGEMMLPVLPCRGEQLTREINTIMPATPAKRMPKTRSLIMGMRSSHPMRAPTGSARPERKEYRKALPLEPVA